MKAVLRRLLINYYNRKNNNRVHPRSYCSYRISKKFVNVTINQNSIVDERSDIGQYTYIGFHSFVSSASIGRYCSIANHVNIGPGDHKIDKLTTSSLFQNNPRVLVEQPCELGHDVWVGVGATVLRGIGHGAIVGAHALVTRDVPPFGIVVGVPARLMRRRFHANTIAAIEASSWWDLSPTEARPRIDELCVAVRTDLKVEETDG